MKFRFIIGLVAATIAASSSSVDAGFGKRFNRGGCTDVTSANICGLGTTDSCGNASSTAESFGISSSMPSGCGIAESQVSSGCAPQVSFVEKTVMVPQQVTEMRTVTKTLSRQEPRTRAPG